MNSLIWHSVMAFGAGISLNLIPWALPKIGSSWPGMGLLPFLALLDGSSEIVLRNPLGSMRASDNDFEFFC